DLSYAEKEPKYFRTWMDKYRPDVVFTLYNNVLAWLKAAGRGVPEDIGVIQLEWRAARPEIAGMNQHNLVTGEAAVDMIVSQIHNNETGVQEFPRATLIGATWVMGSSVREQARSDTGIRAGGANAKAQTGMSVLRETGIPAGDSGVQTGMSVPPFSVTHVSRRNLPH